MERRNYPRLMFMRCFLKPESFTIQKPDLSPLTPRQAPSAGDFIGFVRETLWPHFISQKPTSVLREFFPCLLIEAGIRNSSITASLASRDKKEQHLSLTLPSLKLCLKKHVLPVFGEWQQGGYYC